MDDDVIRIPLRARDGSVRAWAIVDREDADLGGLQCSLTGNGYVQMARGGITKQMHRVVAERSNGARIDGHLMVDHINGCKIDNRRSNLRMVTPSQNATNRAASRNGTSQYLGVSYESFVSRWRAQIAMNGRDINLGRFDTEMEAAIAYDRAAREYHGEYARLNFPDGDA